MYSVRSALQTLLGWCTRSAFLTATQPSRMHLCKLKRKRAREGHHTSDLDSVMCCRPFEDFAGQRLLIGAHRVQLPVLAGHVRASTI